MNWEHGREYHLFIGRWQPLHLGHEEMIRSVLIRGKAVAIGVRDCKVDEDNPYNLEQRLRMVEAAFNGEEVVVFPVPDVAKIHVGRAVGYGVEHHPAVEGHSGTSFRQEIANGSTAWRDHVSVRVARVLEDIGGVP